jgi:pilus assembly protein Flp/PilA
MGSQLSGGTKMRVKIEQLKKKGQGLVEYALILVLIAIVVILILTWLGSQVNTTFSTIGSGLGTA